MVKSVIGGYLLIASNSPEAKMNDRKVIVNAIKSNEEFMRDRSDRDCAEHTKCLKRILHAIDTGNAIEEKNAREYLDSWCKVFNIK
jgi:hypothetical protein